VRDARHTTDGCDMNRAPAAIDDYELNGVITNAATKKEATKQKQKRGQPHPTIITITITMDKTER